MPSTITPTKFSVDDPTGPGAAGELRVEPPAVQSIDPQKITLFPIRAFLAFGWIRAGIEKIIEREWWTGDHLRGFLIDPALQPLPFMTGLGEWLGGPIAPGIAFAVMVAEVIIGVFLLTGKRLPVVLVAAISLNLVFVLFGAVAPSAFYLVIQLTLLLATGALALPSRSRLTAMLMFFATASMVVLTRYVSTLDPTHVIDDPAIVLITIAGIFVVTQALTMAKAALPAPARWSAPARADDW